MVWASDMIPDRCLLGEKFQVCPTGRRPKACWRDAVVSRVGGKDIWASLIRDKKQKIDGQQNQRTKIKKQQHGLDPFTLRFMQE